MSPTTPLGLGDPIHYFCAQAMSDCRHICVCVVLDTRCAETRSTTCELCRMLGFAPADLLPVGPASPIHGRRVLENTFSDVAKRHSVHGSVEVHSRARSKKVQRVDPCPTRVSIGTPSKRRWSNPSHSAPASQKMSSLSV